MLNWHTGQTLLRQSHESMHSEWYEWKHGSDLISSPTEKLQRHTRQLREHR